MTNVEALERLIKAVQEWGADHKCIMTPEDIAKDAEAIRVTKRIIRELLK